MSDPEPEPKPPVSAFHGAAELLEGFEFEDPCVDEPRLGFEPWAVPEP